MKELKLAKKVDNIFGKPMRIVDYNEPNQMVTYKCAHCGMENTEVEKQRFIEAASMTDLLILMVYGIPRDKLTTKDSIEAGRFMSQLRAAKDGVLKLEEAEHDWIKKVVQDHGTSVFGVNTCLLMDFLDSFERIHEAKEKEGK